MASGNHDLVVEHIANQLVREGWIVWADLPGWDKPSPIGQDNRVPDIEAAKNGWRRIIEVESQASLKADTDQQSVFRRHAGQRSDTTFLMYVYRTEKGNLKCDQVE